MVKLQPLAASVWPGFTRTSYVLNVVVKTSPSLDTLVLADRPSHPSPSGTTWRKRVVSPSGGAGTTGPPPPPPGGGAVQAATNRTAPHNSTVRFNVVKRIARMVRHRTGGR